MGMEFRPYYFAREWIKAGHRVDIIAADFSHLRRINPKARMDFQEEKIDGIHYHWIKTRIYDGNGIKRAITMAQFILKLLWNIKRIIRDLEPDIVIDSSTYPLDTYVGQKIRRKSKKKVKVIHEVHDMWPSTLVEAGGMSRKHPFVIIMQIGENSAYKNSDYVVSLLPNAEAYMKEHGLQPGKFKCIPNGIAEEEWKNARELPQIHKAVFKRLKTENKFIVGYFGGHALSNALDSMLNIAAGINDEFVEFVLVGDGVEKKNLMNKARQMGLNNVTFLSPVDKRSIPNLCAEFDCIFMCGLESPLYRFGLCLNKMFDAMASGKPTICALNVKSYFTEYKCGYDVDISDKENICNIIINIKNMSDAEKAKISAAGKKAVEKRFNYSILSKDFLSIMEEDNEVRITK